MFFALLAVPIIIVLTQELDTGALAAVYSYQDAVSGEMVECSFGTGIFDASWKEIISGLAWGLGYFGMPHILVRFMSIKKSSMIKKSASVAIVWVILTLGAAIAIAIIARTYILSDGTSLALTLIPAGAQQNIFIKIVDDVFPPFIAGILLSAIIAASMSTADSQLLVASSSFTSDIYKPILRKNKASEKELLWVGRLVVLVVTVIALLISLSGLKATNAWASNIMAMVENAWGLFGSAFGPVVILSLFWKRFNYSGAVFGIVAGALVDILWLVLFTSTVADAVIYNTGIYEIIPGFVAGAIAAVVATLCTKAPSKEVIDIYNNAIDTSIDD